MYSDFQHEELVILKVHPLVDEQTWADMKCTHAMPDCIGCTVEVLINYINIFQNNIHIHINIFKHNIHLNDSPLIIKQTQLSNGAINKRQEDIGIR